VSDVSPLVGPAARPGRIPQKGLLERTVIEASAIPPDSERSRQRLARLVGLLLSAVVVIATVVAITLPHDSTTKITRQMAAQVDALLAGIPETGTTLGSPSAPVTVTEFGDLQCPVCMDLAVGSGVESRLISDDVRSDRVKLVYRSLDTASLGSPIANVFPTQQAAAYAAGLQHRAWYYIEFFYRAQGSEGTGYVTPAYLDRLAEHVPGLDYNLWQVDRHQPGVIAQVRADATLAARRHFTMTPTLLVRGPRGEATPITGVPSYGTLEAEISSVR
jgi:protein-disulfide isomerase